MIDYKNLRQAKASELTPFCFWYRKDGESFHVVNNASLPRERYEQFRNIVRILSEAGRIYVRADKPGFPLDSTVEGVFKSQLKKHLDYINK